MEGRKHLKFSNCNFQTNWIHSTTQDSSSFKARARWLQRGPFCPKFQWCSNIAISFTEIWFKKNACYTLEKQHCVNNSWQLKETMITLKHKKTTQTILFPPALNETWEGIKDVEVKTGIINLWQLSMPFELLWACIASVQKLVRIINLKGLKCLFEE